MLESKRDQLSVIVGSYLVYIEITINHEVKK